MAWVRNLHIQQGTRKLKLVVDYKQSDHLPYYRLVDKETNEAIAGLEEVTLEGHGGPMVAYVKLRIDNIEVNPADVQPETIAEPDKGTNMNDGINNDGGLIWTEPKDLTLPLPEEDKFTPEAI